MGLREEVVLMYTTEDILKKLVKINSTNLPGNEMDMVKKKYYNFFQNQINYEIIDHGNNRGSLIIELEGIKKEKLDLLDIEILYQ